MYHWNEEGGGAKDEHCDICFEYLLRQYCATLTCKQLPSSLIHRYIAGTCPTSDKLQELYHRNANFSLIGKYMIIYSMKLSVSVGGSELISSRRHVVNIHKNYYFCFSYFETFIYCSIPYDEVLNTVSQIKMLKMFI